MEGAHDGDKVFIYYSFNSVTAVWRAIDKLLRRESRYELHTSHIRLSPDSYGAGYDFNQLLRPVQVAE
jgi:hypothetical protein